ncbi:hypothetical protein TNCV_43361 [Trichonephila clavipes]|nr:hypothetical protein TNCV_43361 [Trichonephila clavipes]
MTGVLNVMILSTVSQNTCRVGVMHVKSVEAQTPYPGVVWKLGEGVPAQMSSSSLDHGSKLSCSSPRAIE